MLTKEMIDSLDPVVKAFLELKSSIGSKLALRKLKFIETELLDLGIHKSDLEFVDVLIKALYAADILSNKALTEFIEEHLSLLGAL